MYVLDVYEWSNFRETILILTKKQGSSLPLLRRIPVITLNALTCAYADK